MVMAIQVYEDPERPSKYIAWDGQHTIIALFIIQQKVFGERTAKATGFTEFDVLYVDIGTLLCPMVMQKKV